MRGIVELIIELFPQLEYATILDRQNPAPADSKDKQVIKDEGLQVWLNWFKAQEGEFEYLRAQFTSKTSLFCKRLGKTKYLIVLNQKENTTQLINHFTTIPQVSVDRIDKKTAEKESKKAPASSPQATSSTIDEKLQSAIKIQQMIIPRETSIRANFKNFFVVHQQQDVIGGDFYWYKKIGKNALVGLIDCTGHSIEGAMASMVCNSLLNQVYDETGVQSLEEFVISFYEQMNIYNDTTIDMMDYGIGAEIGMFYFDYDNRDIKFVSTGISAILKNDDGLEVLRMKKLIDYSQVREITKEKVIPMHQVQELYAFTDGLTDQFDSNDTKKLGSRGVQRMIESETDFSSEYYREQIDQWKGDNMQYDDITLMGVAI